MREGPDLCFISRETYSAKHLPSVDATWLNVGATLEDVEQTKCQVLSVFGLIVPLAPALVPRWIPASTDLRQNLPTDPR